MKKADTEYQKDRDEQRQIEKWDSIKELDADIKRLKKPKDCKKDGKKE